MWVITRRIGTRIIRWAAVNSSTAVRIENAADTASATTGPRPANPCVALKQIAAMTAPMLWPVSRAVPSMPLAPPARSGGAEVRMV